MLAADPDVAGERKRETGAGGDAVDGGDHRLVDAVQRLALFGDPRVFVEEFVERLIAFVRARTGEIGTAAEATAGTGPDYDPDVVVSLDVRDHVEDVGFVLLIDRVEALGLVERDGRDVTGPVEIRDQVLVCHGRSPAIAIVGIRQQDNAATAEE